MRYLDDPASLAELGSAADRTLAARLKYTRVKRGGSEIRAEIDQVAGLSWFNYQAYGIRTGVAEGVVLGRNSDLQGRLLRTLTAESGASLIKLTRAAIDPLVEHWPRTPLPEDWLTLRQTVLAREVLELGEDYEATLAGLGKHTRRNLRAALKLAEARKFSFGTSTGAGLVPQPMRRLLAQATRPMGLQSSAIERLEAYVDATGQPFRSVVRDANGDLISYCCGYFGQPATAYLLYQLNSAAYHKIGPSLLHRALLMRWLIQQKATELVFVHGCIGVLRHACVPQPLEVVWLIRKSLSAYVRASLVGLARPTAPIGRLARQTLAAELFSANSP